MYYTSNVINIPVGGTEINRVFIYAYHTSKYKVPSFNRSKSVDVTSVKVLVKKNTYTFNEFNRIIELCYIIFNEAFKRDDRLDLP